MWKSGKFGWKHQSPSDGEDNLTESIISLLVRSRTSMTRQRRLSLPGIPNFCGPPKTQEETLLLREKLPSIVPLDDV